MIGQAAHRIAAARIEQKVGRRIRQVGPEHRPHLRPGGKGKAVLGPERPIGPGIGVNPATRRPAGQPQKRRRLKRDEIAARGVKLVIAPVQRGRQRQGQQGIIPGPQAGFLMRGQQPQRPLIGQVIADIFDKPNGRTGLLQDIIRLVQPFDPGRDDQVGIGVDRCGPAKIGAQRQVRPGIRVANAADHRIQPQPFGPAQQVAVQPVARQGDPVERGYFCAKPQPARFLFADLRGERQGQVGGVCVRLDQTGR